MILLERNHFSFDKAWRRCREVTAGVKGLAHLVGRHGELLELCVKLWVALRGGGKLRLCSGLPAAAKKTQTCDSDYDLHKDLSLCKSQRERGK